MRLIVLVLCSGLVFNLDFVSANRCERINTTLLPSCDNVGYNFTASFPNVDQKTHQEYVASEVALFADRFENCSSYSRLFVCSRYVPKCNGAAPGQPVLPCREVCEQFVKDCDQILKESGLRGLFWGYCGLLDSEKQKSTNCLKPDGFVYKVNGTKEIKPPSCEQVIEPACFRKNYSVLGNESITRLRSSLKILAPVLNSSCSPNLERFSCFIQTAPCVTNNGSILFTCQSLCEEVKSSCDREFQRHNIFFPKCMPYYPETTVGNGLCQLTQWPVPWPSPSQTSGNNNVKKLECYCDNCGVNNTCTTDGSCFMQHSTDVNGTSSLIRACLNKGPQRNFICDPSLPDKDVLCCEKDFCNGNLSVSTTPPNAVIRQGGAKPTTRAKTTAAKTPTDKDINSNVHGAHQETHRSFSPALVAGAVVSSIAAAILFVVVLVYFIIKKRRENAQAERPLPKFIDANNISANGTAVTIGERKKTYNDNMFENESALY